MCIALPAPTCLTDRLVHSYEFDVNSKTQVFEHKRVFAYIDAGLPDGIQVDRFGNVYSSCGDGVHVSCSSVYRAYKHANNEFRSGIVMVRSSANSSLGKYRAISSSPGTGTSSF